MRSRSFAGSRLNAEELGIDPDRLVAGGGSAGGHIATLATVDDKFDNPQDPMEFDTSVKALLLFCAAFTQLERDSAPDVNVFQHLDEVFPPVIAFYGADENWKVAGDRLIEELRSRDGDVESWAAEGHGHMFFRRDQWLTLCLKKADAFLVERGLLSGESKLVAPESGEELVVE